MKFLGNMGISPVTIQFLRTLGHDAKRLLEENLERMPDSEILEKARRENSIILTNDLDFGTLLAASGAELPSVVTFRLDHTSPENVNRHLVAILNQYGMDLEQGAIITVSETRIRVRRLPL